MAIMYQDSELDRQIREGMKHSRIMNVVPAIRGSRRRNAGLR